MQFTAEGKDSSNNPVGITPAWTVSGGGTISSSGLFAASTAGNYTVTATSGSISATSTVTVTAGAINLALKKPAQSSTGTASLAFDGDINSRWESAFADPQWIYVDLQGRYDLNKVILKWETAAGKNYSIQVSSDATEWNSVYTKTNGAGGVEEISLNASGRYVRMMGTTRTTGWGYSLWEFEVYGTPSSSPVLTSITVTPTNTTINVENSQQFTSQGKDQFGNNMNAAVNWSTTGGGVISSTGLFTANIAGGPFTIKATSGSISGTATVTVNSVPTTNIALNKPSTTSSNEYGSASATNDGNATTRWSSLFTDDQWVYIDLQARYNLSKVVLNWEAAYGKSYDIQVSDNATNWTTIYTTNTSDGGIDNISLSGAGRYVRMNGKTRGTGYGYSLYEFEVYGTAIATARLNATEEETAFVSLNPNPTSDVLNISGLKSGPRKSLFIIMVLQYLLKNS